MCLVIEIWVAFTWYIEKKKKMSTLIIIEVQEFKNDRIWRYNVKIKINFSHAIATTKILNQRGISIKQIKEIKWNYFFLNLELCTIRYYNKKETKNGINKKIPRW